jgi:hypothetical protein
MVEDRLSKFNRGGRSKSLPIPTATFSSAKDIFDNMGNSDDQQLRYGLQTPLQTELLGLIDDLS